jgi:hypothetical protein
MTTPGARFRTVATAAVATGSKSAVMAAAGAVAGFGLWIGMTVVLMPFLSFMALGTGPFVAVVVGAIVLTRSVTRPCGAPDWAQRRKAALWVGAFCFLAYACVGVAIEAPHLILFWPG